jgi:SNF2 family DNA or RNA helicase
MDTTVDTFFTVDGYKRPVQLIYRANRIWINIKYNKKVIAYIKTMEQSKWHGFEEPPVKMWSILNSQRNAFQLDFMQGKNPYAPFEAQLDYNTLEFNRPLYRHQREGVAHVLSRPASILACEMGTGKTLMALESAERHLSPTDVLWYIGPRSGIYAVQRDLAKWRAKVFPERYLTYEKLSNIIKQVGTDIEVPKMVIFDESSKVKNPTANRTQACLTLANLVREHHPDDYKLVLMSGTPAPKSPVDWWSQCEIACPGFIKEGNLPKFKRRLSIIEEKESAAGGMYASVVTWLDDENKCATCGQPKEHINHAELVAQLVGGTAGHQFVKSANEVAKLYRRMQGLTLVRFKKDCLDLPEKIYEIVEIKPTIEILRTAKLIKQQCPTAIQAITLLRELSDGFQYQPEKTGMETCSLCKGVGTIVDLVPPDDYDPNLDNTGEIKYVEKTIDCHKCGGAKETAVFQRVVVESDSSPKDQYLIDDLDEHEDVGRLVVWGGFTGTIDKLVRLAKQQGWNVLQVDGRGFRASTYDDKEIPTNIALDAFDASHPDYEYLKQQIPKLCFIGSPEAGGMALNLTGSPTEIFYSNTFRGEARMQAEDRFHRPGADKNRGCTIKDYLHLPVDRLILENLKKKRRMQEISMGELNEYID